VSSVNPTKTWAPWRPVRPKKIEPKAPSLGAKPIREYSRNCVSRNTSPSAIVRTSPACRPARLSFLIDWSAQWIVNDDVTRIAVFTPATKTGRWNGGSGHGEPATTRTKKYAVKNEPKTMTSDAMKRNIPSTRGSTREL
jgi:hypothetical protein